MSAITKSGTICKRCTKCRVRCWQHKHNELKSNNETKEEKKDKERTDFIPVELSSKFVGPKWRYDIWKHKKDDIVYKVYEEGMMDSNVVWYTGNGRLVAFLSGNPWKPPSKNGEIYDKWTKGLIHKIAEKRVAS
jgi:hypothetical protein